MAEKNDKLVKAKRQVVKAVPLGLTSTHAHQEGLTLAAIVAMYTDSGSATTPPTGITTAGAATKSTAAATVIGENRFPDADEYIAIMEEDLGYSPDDVNIPADAARTAILNATRSIAEINFRRKVRQLTTASIYGASQGQIAKYFDALTKLGRDIESGITAAEHEYLAAKIAEAQVKANIVSPKLSSRATVISSVISDRMRGRITNAQSGTGVSERNAILGTEVSIANATNDTRINISYNNFLASIFSAQVTDDRGLASILAAGASQMGKPGIAWITVTEV